MLVTMLSRKEINVMSCKQWWYMNSPFHPWIDDSLFILTPCRCHRHVFEIVEIFLLEIMIDIKNRKKNQVQATYPIFSFKLSIAFEISMKIIVKIDKTKCLVIRYLLSDFFCNFGKSVWMNPRKNRERVRTVTWTSSIGAKTEKHDWIEKQKRTNENGWSLDRDNESEFLISYT